jgi:hypothetical protein
MAQSNPNWVAHIVADCPPDEIQDAMRTIVEFFNDDRIKLTILPERYNDWGHTPRQYGLDNATEEWVCMTGEDNYYTPEFVDTMLKEGKDHHFVYCDMVHNWIRQDYIPIKTRLELGRIDIGCFMVKTNMGNKLQLKKEHEWADWYFVQDFENKYKVAKYKKVNKILYVHN